jgi:hypothetical protein
LTTKLQTEEAETPLIGKWGPMKPQSLDEEARATPQKRKRKRTPKRPLSDKQREHLLSEKHIAHLREMNRKRAEADKRVTPHPSHSDRLSSSRHVLSDRLPSGYARHRTFAPPPQMRSPTPYRSHCATRAASGSATPTMRWRGSLLSGLCSTWRRRGFVQMKGPPRVAPRASGCRLGGDVMSSPGGSPSLHAHPSADAGLAGGR